MNPWEFVLRGLAVAYIAIASVDLFKYVRITKKFTYDELRDIGIYPDNVMDENNNNKLGIDHTYVTTSNYQAGIMTATKYLLNRKPFNCHLCMMFWCAIPVFYLHLDMATVFALACVGMLVHGVDTKLKTFMS